VVVLVSDVHVHLARDDEEEILRPVSLADDDLTLLNRSVRAVPAHRLRDVHRHLLEEARVDLILEPPQHVFHIQVVPLRHVLEEALSVFRGLRGREGLKD